MSNKCDRYTYRITWSGEDAEHVALCAEFPSLSWLAPTPQDALAGMQELIRQVVADMRGHWRNAAGTTCRAYLQWTVRGAGATRNSPRARTQGGGRGREPEPPGERATRTLNEVSTRRRTLSPHVSVQGELADVRARLYHPYTPAWPLLSTSRRS